MRMVERRGGPRLAEMAVDDLPLLLLLLKHELQRDAALQARILRLPDHTHAARADLLDQAVMEQLFSGFDRHLDPS